MGKWAFRYRKRKIKRKKTSAQYCEKNFYCEAFLYNIVIIQYIIYTYTQDCSLRISVCGNCLKKKLCLFE